MQVLARRDLDNDGEDAVTLNYSIDGGADPDRGARPSGTDGDRLRRPGDTYYHIIRGHVTGAPMSRRRRRGLVHRGGQTSDSFTFHVEKTTPADVLILADTDYTGPSNFPAYAPADGQPPFLSDYENAVPAGTTSDVYDVDAMGAAPDHLGVLGHYDAVIWYTANDLLSASPASRAGREPRPRRTR